MFGHSGEVQAASRLKTEDQAALCAVSAIALATLGSIRSSRDADLRERADGILEKAGGYSMLPKKIRCEDHWVQLSPRRYGTYMDAFQLSSNRREILISGGYQAGPLEGADGFCLFRLDDEEWHLVGCQVLGVS
jgi:hypothetical protein